MKKVLAILAIVSLGTAAAAYAATTYYLPDASGQFTMGTTSGKQMTIKPSANVGFGYEKHADGISYTIGAYHGQGNRLFGGSSTDTNIFYKEITTPGVATALSNQDLPAAPTPPAGAFGAGWTASK